MKATTDELLKAVTRLHQYLLDEHWENQALRGPDSGIRFNARFGRFAKSYLEFLPWREKYVYFQAQAYWILSNWLLLDLLGHERYGHTARESTEYVVSMQVPEGYWRYPNPEWKGRIATVEGCFASLALLESYHRLKDPRFLDAAKNFHDYMVTKIGFRRQARVDMLAVNYFAHNSGDGGGVPNNSTLALWMLGELFKATGDESVLFACPPLESWLQHVQLPTGELPYALGVNPRGDRTHFLCHQYNAFEFIDLVHYESASGSLALRPVLQRLAEFLSTGLTGVGACRFDCGHETPEVAYYTVALARALSTATELGIGDYQSLAQRAYRHALAQQRRDGGFRFFSRANYGILTDRRSYPRNLSMMLYHLTSELMARRQPATPPVSPLVERTA